MGPEEEHYDDLARQQVKRCASLWFSADQELEVILASSSMTQAFWVGYYKTEHNPENEAVYEVVVNRQTKQMAVSTFRRYSTEFSA